MELTKYTLCLSLSPQQEISTTNTSTAIKPTQTPWKQLIHVMYKTISPKLSFNNLQLHLVVGLFEKHFLMSQYFKQTIKAIEERIRNTAIVLVPLLSKPLILQNNKIYLCLAQNMILEELRHFVTQSIIQVAVKYYTKLYESTDHLHIQYNENNVLLELQDLKKNYRKTLVKINTNTHTINFVRIDNLASIGMVDMGAATVGIDVINTKLYDIFKELKFDLNNVIKIKTKKDI
jgi:hypothetical protein